MSWLSIRGDKVSTVCPECKIGALIEYGSYPHSRKCSNCGVIYKLIKKGGKWKWQKA